MGSLAFYSAMAGVGKGWREATIAKEDSKQKQLQRAHDTAIQKLRMDFENTLADKKMTQASQFHEAEMGLREEGIDVQREGLQETRRHRETMEGVAEREVGIKEEVAGAQAESYRASAEQARATAKALNEGRYGRHSSGGARWTVTKRREDVPDPETSLPMTVETAAITDKQTGFSFEPRGPHMVLLGASEIKVPETAQDKKRFDSAVRTLKANPDKWPTFAEYYGFIPLSVWGNIFGTGSGSSLPDSESMEELEDNEE